MEDACASAGADGRPPLALLVDDSSEVRAMLAEMLEESGFRCLQAEDAERAMTLLGDQQICVGILDIGLPGMSGAELAWKIRERDPDLPLLAVSGMLDVWDRDDLVDLGFVRVFQKPFDGDELVRACQRLCRRGADMLVEGQPARGRSQGRSSAERPDGGSAADA